MEVPFQRPSSVDFPPSAVDCEMAELVPDGKILNGDRSVEAFRGDGLLLMSTRERRDEILLLEREMERDVAGLRMTCLLHLPKFEEGEKLWRKEQRQQLMKGGVDGVHGSPFY